MSRLPSETRDVLLSEWYAYIKALPCYVSGEYGRSEAAHLRIFPSSKTGELLPRSHATIAAFACIPLTPELHRTDPKSIHAVGEDAFWSLHNVPHPAGWIAKHLALFMIRRMEMNR